ncbi:MAG: bifunctional folylpolyglutamate synthase/dihydrofolate synthase [Alphaproteobacteria bacterium]|nr:bifunctional folylpolyglutamate synthase/dihydrofolate synthase [Alphaproteobacteria bacterium]
MSGAAPSDAILERLMRLHPKAIDLSLDRMRVLLNRLGNPERRLPPVFHVAGTNGKGSTCAYLRAMLEAAGLRVHVYTSPHLVSFHERIRLAGKLISEDALQILLDECEHAAAETPITFFEITTAAALLAFARVPADALVLEVGLGGKLDATNVIDAPLVSIITPVDLDHQHYLGDTIDLIAAEKAGIVKAGRPVVVGPQRDDAFAVIESEALRQNAPLIVYGQEFSAHEERGRMVYQDLQGVMDLPLPKLFGAHQIANAATAIAALKAQDIFTVPDTAFEQGLKSVSWPARMQRLTYGPIIADAPDGSEIWLDGGHNPHAGAAIAAALADLEEQRPRPLYMIVGMLNTKDPGGYLAHFRGLARHVSTIAIPGEANALGAGALYDAARKAGLNADPADDLGDALDQIGARVQLDDGEIPPRILIGGSLYLAGRVLAQNG